MSHAQKLGLQYFFFGSFFRSFPKSFSSCVSLNVYFNLLLFIHYFLSLSCLVMYTETQWGSSMSHSQWSLITWQRPKTIQVFYYYLFYYCSTDLNRREWLRWKCSYWQYRDSLVFMYSMYLYTVYTISSVWGAFYSVARTKINTLFVSKTVPHACVWVACARELSEEAMV